VETPPAETPPPPPPPTTPPPPIIATAPANRSADILAALATAHDAATIAHIIDYYGFTFAQAIRDGDERHRFYTINEGSGDIMIGIANNEDGFFQRMHFSHFTNGPAPTDIIELLIFMERM